VQTNIKQKGFNMPNCTYFKIEANGILLPEIYFNYDQAKAALRNLENNNVALIGRVIMY